MNSFQENQRQIRIAIVAVAVIFAIGVAGFMIFEKFSLLDSIWLTVITLATIGYGDIVAHSPAGRLFTILLILFGLGAVAYGLQATAGARAANGSQNVASTQQKKKKKGKFLGLFGGGSDDKYEELTGTVAPGRDRVLFEDAAKEVRKGNHENGPPRQRL